MNIPSTVLSQLHDRTATPAAATRDGSPENPANDLDGADWTGGWGEGFFRTDSGAKVNHRTALKYAPFWRALNLVSGKVATIPFITYSNDADDVRSRAKKHPAYRLLRRRANSEMSARTFRQTLQAHAMSRGNGYAYIYRHEGSYEPEELIPLNPDLTYPKRVDGELVYITTVGGSPRVLNPENVLHIKGLGFDGLQGYDVVSVGRNSLEGGIAAGKYGNRFFDNNAAPSVVIESAKALTLEAINKLRQSWTKNFGGLDRSHKPAVLEDGMKVKPFSFNAKESQLLELRLFEILPTSNLTGVPPHKLGHPGRTAYASLEQENQAFLDDGMDYWFCTWEDECNLKLTTEEEQAEESIFCEFVRGALVRADIKSRFDAYKTASGGAPFMLRNEIRKLENLPPVEGGDKMIDPLNMTSAATKKGEAKQRRKIAHLRRALCEQKRRIAARDTHVMTNREALRRLLVDIAGRMVKRLGVHARKAAKDAKTFTKSIEALDAEHRSVIVEALDPAVGLAITGRKRTGAASRLADRMFANLKRDMLEAAGRAKADTLASEVDAAMVAAESQWPTAIAAAVLRKQELPL
jgi:HK97 family phage portal protein